MALVTPAGETVSASGRMPGPEEISIPDPFVWLGYAAAVTERIRLATGVLILPQRHPLYVAKEAATLDRLSRGRAILGVGIGWLEEEFAAGDLPAERLAVHRRPVVVGQGAGEQRGGAADGHRLEVRLLKRLAGLLVHPQRHEGGRRGAAVEDRVVAQAGRDPEEGREPIAGSGHGRFLRIGVRLPTQVRRPD